MTHTTPTPDGLPSKSQLQIAVDALKSIQHAVNNHYQDDPEHAKACLQVDEALVSIAQAAPAGDAAAVLPKELVERVIARLNTAQIFPLSAELRRAIAATERAATQPAGEAPWWAHTQKVVKELAVHCFGGPDLETQISCGSAYVALVNSLTAKDGLQIAAPISEDAGEARPADVAGLTPAFWYDEGATCSVPENGLFSVTVASHGPRGKHNRPLYSGTDVQALLSK